MVRTTYSVPTYIVHGWRMAGGRPHRIGADFHTGFVLFFFFGGLLDIGYSRAVFFLLFFRSFTFSTNTDRSLSLSCCFALLCSVSFRFVSFGCPALPYCPFSSSPHRIPRVAPPSRTSSIPSIPSALRPAHSAGSSFSCAPVVLRCCPQPRATTLQGKPQQKTKRRGKKQNPRGKTTHHGSQHLK